MNHESSGNAHAANYNDWNGSYDIGLWQINAINWDSWYIFFIF